MPEDSEIIIYRVIQRIGTGEIMTDPAPVFAGDWPYQDAPPQQPLVRYMDLWKFEDLLKTQELYFCRADKFTDLLEGALSEEGIHGTSPSDVAFRATVKMEAGEYQKLAEYRKIAKQCTFVNCWHMNNDESQTMWDTYTSSPDSVLVISNVERLQASLKQPVFMSAVKYISKNTPRTEFDERSLFFYKDISFAFEREYRLLVDLGMPCVGGSIRQDHPDDFFRRVPVDLSTLIYGIQMHPQATALTEARVDALVKSFLPTVKHV